MRQLFWRFFLVFWATLLIAMLLVKLTFVLQDNERWQPTPFTAPHAMEQPKGQPRFEPPPPKPAPPGEFGGPPPPLAQHNEHRPAHIPEPPFWRKPYFHLTLLLAASILFSYLLARYIASPVRQLSQALSQLANQQWQTQLGPDLTRRRDEFGSLSRNFNLMATQAAEAIASQRRLLHDVSHELRSPLARMQILTGLVAQSPAEAADLLTKIEQEVAKLDGLVAEILTFSRLESGTVRAQNIAVDLGELVQSIADDAQLEANCGNKFLQLKLDAVPPVNADPALLYSAIENVVRNAVKFTPTGTVVGIMLTQDHNRAYLSVTDQGPGVDDAHVSQLFTPFFRAQSSHSGIGLGLSIAKRAIEACHGEISAANILKQNKVAGFEVRISLPLSSCSIH